MYQEIKKCRICGNEELVSLLNLGNQALTGIFPKSKEEEVGSGPLEIIKCVETKNNQACGLVQLKHNYELSLLYGQNYGYRSGLNLSMVKHLHSKVKKITELIKLEKDDLVIDIGSNDSTLLQGYPKESLKLVGIDPTGVKFKKYYPSHISLIPDFFSSSLVRKEFGNQKAKVITSISMFYDLEEPMKFVAEISEILSDNGVWVFEQSYMPTMLEKISYDTICHEHLEYYRLKQIQWMLEKTGLKILDVEFNDINGGSFSVMATKKESKLPENKEKIDAILRDEEIKELYGSTPYEQFKENVSLHKEKLVQFIQETHEQGKKILGYGASTKGNVILQYCGLTEKQIPYIAEVNEDKFGSFTPGTRIPIISEKDAKAMNPDYFMVLPWHFKENIIEKERNFLASGKKLFFPLPKILVI